ncbi:hypothetical protein VTK73DRAFT_8691 [Phialemonium thermophilum]|uniref:Secreted protein n=1 Tax=Phialemonium thermophilum TaxID=223376 RepID=A0ABR3W6X0_9PEZI
MNWALSFPPRFPWSFSPSFCHRAHKATSAHAHRNGVLLPLCTLVSTSSASSSVAAYALSSPVTSLLPREATRVCHCQPPAIRTNGVPQSIESLVARSLSVHSRAGRYPWELEKTVAANFPYLLPGTIAQPPPFHGPLFHRCRAGSQYGETRTCDRPTDRTNDRTNEGRPCASGISTIGAQNVVAPPHLGVPIWHADSCSRIRG